MGGGAARVPGEIGRGTGAEGQQRHARAGEVQWARDLENRTSNLWQPCSTLSQGGGNTDDGLTGLLDWAVIIAKRSSSRRQGHACARLQDRGSSLSICGFLECCRPPLRD